MSTVKASPSAEEPRAVFQFAQKIRPQRLALQKSLLLWRIIQCQPEAREGKIRLLKHAFLKQFQANEADFQEFSPQLQRSIAMLFKGTGRHFLQDLKPFIMRVAGIYRKEALLLSDPGKIMAFDILFQTIQLLSLNRDLAACEKTIAEMGLRNASTSLTLTDRQILCQNFRAYIDLCQKIKTLKEVRSVLDLRDDLLAAVARKNPGVMIYFLECMFRSIIAQVLLARKYRCDTLIVEWLAEYGHEVDEMVRVSEYIPYETNFLQFRSAYRKGILALKHASRSADSDEFLLRSLGNFYTSWIMRTSRQIPA